MIYKEVLICTGMVFKNNKPKRYKKLKDNLNIFIAICSSYLTSEDIVFIRKKNSQTFYKMEIKRCKMSYRVNKMNIISSKLR